MNDSVQNVTPPEGPGRPAKGEGGSRAGPRKRTSVQKQLEGNVRRTVYICDIDQQVVLQFTLKGMHSRKTV